MKTYEVYVDVDTGIIGLTIIAVLKVYELPITTVEIGIRNCILK